MKTKIYEELSDLFPLWREVTLENKGHEKREAAFITEVFKEYQGEIHQIIDLGGGVGLHADLLSHNGYSVTVFDQSEKALDLAKNRNQSLKVMHGHFESIGVEENFDASICMWSTLAYIYSEKDREQFFGWQRDHVKKVIILDQANFYNYPKDFHKEYFGEDANYTMKVIRDWKLEGTTKDTTFVYHIINKITGEAHTVEDAEKQDYVPVEKIQSYLGPEWNLEHLLGDYDLGSRFDKQSSTRMISVFSKK